MRCVKCGSWGINEHQHGRTPGEDLNLCDVCYWRKRAEILEEEMREAIELIFDTACDDMLCQHPKTGETVLSSAALTSRLYTLKLLVKYGKVEILPDGVGRMHYARILD